MKNQSLILAGNYHQWNTAGGNTYVSNPSRSHWVYASPEKKKGDHKTPNDFTFYVTTQTRDSNGYYHHRNNATGVDYYDEGYLGADIVNWGNWQGCVFTTSEAAAIWQALYNEALSNLSSAIRGSTDLSIDGLQARQNARLGHDVKGVLKLARRAVRYSGIGRRVVTVKTAVKALSSAWLQLQYGWKPLLEDIHGVASELKNIYTNTGKMYKGRAGTSGTRVDPASQGYWNGVTNVHTSYSYRCQVGCYLVIPETPETSAARLTSLNPVSMAWELLPYSFVVDWFINIGNYLRALETAMIYQSYFRNGYVSYSNRVDSSAVFSVVGPPPDVWEGSYAMNLSTVGNERHKLASFPYPKKPILNPKFGSGRLLNAAALLGNLLDPYKTERIFRQRFHKGRLA